MIWMLKWLPEHSHHSKRKIKTINRSEQRMVMANQVNILFHSIISPPNEFRCHFHFGFLNNNSSTHTHTVPEPITIAREPPSPIHFLSITIDFQNTAAAYLLHHNFNASAHACCLPACASLPCHFIIFYIVCACNTIPDVMKESSAIEPKVHANKTIADSHRHGYAIVRRYRGKPCVDHKQQQQKREVCSPNLLICKRNM